MRYNDVATKDFYNDVNQRRRFGLSDDDIAKAMRIAPSLVGAVPFPKPNVQRSRAVQHMHLQIATQQVMPRVAKGDDEAIQLLLKIQKREADLLGLDAPKETISRNFNMDLDLDNMTPEQLRELSTEELKLIVLRQASHDVSTVVIETTPEPRPEPDA